MTAELQNRSQWSFNYNSHVSAYIQKASETTTNWLPLHPRSVQAGVAHCGGYISETSYALLPRQLEANFINRRPTQLLEWNQT